MILLIYGDDTFRAQERVNEMRDAFRNKFDVTGMNLSQFPADDQTKILPEEVFGAVCSMPFLSAKRMVVVRDLLMSVRKDTEKAWAEGFKRVPESTILLLWETDEPKATEKTGLFKQLKDMAEAHLYSYPQLAGAALTKWIGDRAKMHGAGIAPDAVRELIERVGPDLWQMNSEIGKLAAYAIPALSSLPKGSVGAVIKAAMVRDLVRPAFEGQIFGLIDAISRREPREALRLLENERQAGANNHYLLSMLMRQVRLLLAARSLLDEQPRITTGEAAEALGAHAFVAGKVLAQARAFSFADLRGTHDLLYRYDVGLKSGRIDVGLATDLVVVDLLKT